ncbi:MULTISPECIES: hypothetical protein [Allobacillus]|uniref:BshB3 potential contributor to bacillithiol synthesis n=1 Tax=Allobacillus halotolerans TaxID=570278 RepID=A0ABS6GM93_9BACI|nr:MULTISPECIES: hypothetical protein [Allobacillus]MBU6080236.1 hypothetical protein [Allobacillus halotolerans]TSJ68443.1 hypothetical protein FPQ10_04470 [Allobacillus sp. SKP2-8]
MYFYLFLTMVVSIIALIITIMIGNQGKKDYNSNKSFSSLSVMYVILIPLIIVFGFIGWYLFL